MPNTLQDQSEATAAGVALPLVDLARLKAANIESMLDTLQKQSEHAQALLESNRDSAVAAIIARFATLERKLQSSIEELRTRLQAELASATIALSMATSFTSNIAEVS